MADPFFDSRGRPQLLECAVLYLDILGTSEVRAGPDAQAHLELLVKGTNTARAAGQSLGNSFLTRSLWFSDNLAHAALLRGKADTETVASMIVDSAAAHQLCFALDGLFARGAAVLGPYHAGPDLVFGPALNRAVALEKEAIYPRIVLGESLYAATPHEVAATLLLQDTSDGVVFIDYLSLIRLWRDPIDEKAGIEAAMGTVRMHGARIMDQLSRFEDNPKIYSKYAWLASYHNFFCRNWIRPDCVPTCLIDCAGTHSFKRVGRFSAGMPGNRPGSTLQQ